MEQAMKKSDTVMTNFFHPRKAKKKGKEIRAAYIDAIDGLDKLLDGIKKASETRISQSSRW
jgi:hypothetical protein